MFFIDIGLSATAVWCLQIPHVNRQEYTLLDVSEDGYVRPKVTCVEPLCYCQLDVQICCICACEGCVECFVATSCLDHIVWTVSGSQMVSISGSHMMLIYVDFFCSCH